MKTLKITALIAVCTFILGCKSQTDSATNALKQAKETTKMATDLAKKNMAEAVETPDAEEQ